MLAEAVANSCQTDTKVAAPEAIGADLFEGLRNTPQCAPMFRFYAGQSARAASDTIQK